MTDKAFGDLTRQTSLTGDEYFAIENADGNSRAIKASFVRTYMDDLVAANLTTHEADTTTHGISTFFATLTSAASLTALLTLLGITFPATDTIVIGDYMVQWGSKAIGTGGSVVSGTITLNTAFGDSDFVIVGTATGAGNGGRNQLAVTCAAASTTTADYEADTGDSSYSITVAQNINWIAIGNAP